METGLRLLMLDGAVHVPFYPWLTADQYAELAEIIDRPGTKSELATVLTERARHWGREFSIEDSV